MEAPHPPDPVAPFCCQRLQSRPGPAVEVAGGVFQPETLGKYFRASADSTSDARSTFSPHTATVTSPLPTTANATVPPINGNVARAAVNRTHPLSIYYQNARGIRTKTNELLLGLLSCDYDLVVLTETWLRADIKDSEFSSNYFIFRHDRDSHTSSLQRGGGVLVAVKSEFACSEVTVDTIELEQVIVRIQLPFYSLVLSCIYIRPKSHPETYTLHSNCIQRVVADSAEQDLVVVLGDYNLPLLSWNFDKDVGGLLPTNASSDSEFTLTESMLSCGLQQINDISNANASIPTILRSLLI